MSLPKNWPVGFPYLTCPSHSPLLTKSHHIPVIKTPSPPSSSPGPSPSSPAVPSISPEFTKTPYPHVKITPITTPAHPANGQHGLFATRPLRPGAFILLYLGTVHPEGDPAAEGSDYDLWLDRDAGVAVDASRCGNEARFVNDYRGVAARPNAEFREVWSARHGERCMALFVLPEGKKRVKQKQDGNAKKGGRNKGSSNGNGNNVKGNPAAPAAASSIAKGEEILVSYGKGFWGHRIPEESG